MKITEEQIRELGSEAILHKKKMSRAFQMAHKELSNQHTIAINVISEYSFYNGQEYAFLKMLRYLEEEG